MCLQSEIIPGFTQVLENLESHGIWKFGFHALKVQGIFVELLESPGIWTYRSIFLIISIQEFSRYTSSEMLSLTTTDYTLLTYSVYVISMSVHCGAAFIENMCTFSNVKSSQIHWNGCGIWRWKVLEFEMSKCVWTLLIQSRFSTATSMKFRIFYNKVGTSLYVRFLAMWFDSFTKYHCYPYRVIC